VQPLAPLSTPNCPDAEPGIPATVTRDQVSPPSRDVATWSVWAFEPALGPPT
jgi:hypothetical protein